MLVEILSRIQFAFTVSFHILFPAFSIGLVTFLTVFEGVWLVTKKEIYLNIVKFWTKVFALTFGMGVVSGIMMEFQFGTNWSGFAEKVGPVLGALFTYEVLTAFFIEAGALGIMIFGWGKVNRYIHFASTVVIFLGVTLSAFWILSANSWMQTPDGVVFEDGRFQVTSWGDVILNPSVIPRFIHMLAAAYLSTLLVILGVSAFYLLKGYYHEFAIRCAKFSIGGLIVIGIAQVYIGDEVGREVHENQPLKTAAIEGVWETQRAAPLVLFAYPSSEREKNLFALEIPYGASLVNTRSWNGKLVGLKSVPKADRPVVQPVFYSFRVMVGIGFLIVFVSLWGLWNMIRGQIPHSSKFLKASMLCSPLGFVAIIAGWFTAEFGRQPWVVYKMVRTENVVSSLNAYELITSLAAIVLVYGFIFGFFFFRYFFRIIKQGPGSMESTRMPYGYFQSIERQEEN